MHYFKKSAAASLQPHPLYTDHSQGYSWASLIDHTTGSVHTGLSMNQLAPGGIIAPHVHSYEEGFYLLEGEVVVQSGEDVYSLCPGDFGAFKVGTPHAWRNTGSHSARWLGMAAPQPKPLGKERDTFFVRNAEAPRSGHPLASSDIKGKLFGHFDPSQIPPPEQRQAGVVGPGVFLKWMIDEQLGARHHRMLFIEYQPGAKIGYHDHTFEEAYFVLSGEVEGTLDGERYLAKPGDVVWTGVGCVHSFVNIGKEPVRWLETFSPQPPQENVFRFMAEWEQKAKEIEG
jgi:quercetin dioxygenase-like cupin family protein